MVFDRPFQSRPVAARRATGLALFGGSTRHFELAVWGSSIQIDQPHFVDRPQRKKSILAYAMTKTSH